MEQDKTESYRALYRVRPLIYHVGDIRLWVPIRQDGIVLWFVYLFLFFILCYVFPVLSWIVPLDRTVTMIVGPIAAAYYTVKLDPAGKTVPRYLRDIIHFLVRPKWFVRWQAIRGPEGRRKLHFAGTVRPYDIMTLPSGEEEWHGSVGMLRGKVVGLQSLFIPASVRVRWHRCSERLSIERTKRSHKKAIVPPASVEGKRTIHWISSQPVQANIYRDKETKTEIWKVQGRHHRQFEKRSESY
ncbi:TcpE family conjugal transfer membrane protein [Cohnella boryungensis]|uniref:TcpE family conjugal transfer membrane protein n=1 Tax=Cohnella boryungensis TaxID=768479 RepID=A0ABV8SGL9_9BACL